jgi:hypothetical protein
MALSHTCAWSSLPSTPHATSTPWLCGQQILVVGLCRGEGFILKGDLLNRFLLQARDDGPALSLLPGRALARKVGRDAILGVFPWGDELPTPMKEEGRLWHTCLTQDAVFGQE